MAHELQPYVGPRPFEQNDEDRFFGRESEVSELLSLVIAHAAVLFYSQSGAGKTSLLNASLVPLLKEEGFEVLPMARVRGLVTEEIQAEKIRNIYVFNVLTSWSEGRIAPQLLAEMSLADFLKSSERPLSREGQPAPRIATFDQFEELFTFYPERWSDRQDFFDQVNEALEADRLLRVVFVMREDYIAELDPYISVLPEKLQIRFRLERLREDDALQAIIGPMKGTDYSFAEGVPEKLVNNLRKVPVETTTGVTHIIGEFVEPVQLQVVCQTLWQKVQPSKEKVITQKHLKAFGDVDEALSDFYESAIIKIAKAAGVNEGVLRRWFEHTLITPSGTRGTVYGGGDTVGEIPAAAIKELVNQHLIRAEVRGGARWYELTHDRLIEPIRTSNQRWLLRRSGAELTRQRLEARAADWVRSGRVSKYLLGEGELLEAKRWIESPNATEVGYSDALLALFQTSRAAVEEAARERDQLLLVEQQRRADAERERAEEQQRRVEEQTRATRHLRRLVAALAVMFLFAAGSTVAAAIYAAHSRTQTQLAKRALEDFRQQKKRADDLKIAIAEKEKEAAKSAEIAANEQKRIAEEARKNAEELTQRAVQAKEQETIARKKAQQNEAAAKEVAQLKTVDAERKIEENKRKAIEDSLSKAKALEKEAFEHSQEGNFSDAIKKYEMAASIYNGIHYARDEANMFLYIGAFYSRQRDYNKSEEAYAKALQITENTPGSDKEDIATIATYLGVVYTSDKKYDKAETQYRKAIKIREDILASGPNNTYSASDCSEVYTRLARLYELQERYPDAELAFKQAVERLEKAVGPESPEVATYINYLAVFYHHRHNYDQAEKLYRRALEIREKALEPDDKNLLQSYDNLAVLYQNQQKYPEAVTLYKQILGSLEKKPDKNAPEIATYLTYLGNLYYTQNKYDEAEQQYQKALATRKEQPEAIALAGSYTTLASFYRERAKYKEAEPLYMQALATIENVKGEKPPERLIADSLIDLSSLYRLWGKYDKAVPLINRALEIQKKALDRTPRDSDISYADLADSLNELGLIYFYQGRYNEAEPLLLQALEDVNKSTGEPENSRVATQQHNLALLYLAQAKYTQAEELEKKVIATEQNLPVRPYVKALSLQALGRIYYRQARYSEAGPLYKQALEMMLDEEGTEEHPAVANILQHQALLFWAQADYAKAEQLERKVIAIYEKTVGSDHLFVSSGQNILAIILTDQHKYAEAERLYKQSAEGLEKELGADSLDVASPLSGLAKLYITQGRYAEAEPLLKRSLAIREKLLGPEHPDVASSANDYGLFYFKQGEYCDAEPLFKRALSIREKALGPNHPYLAETLENYAALLRKKNRASEAIAMEARARAIRAKYPQIISHD